MPIFTPKQNKSPEMDTASVYSSAAPTLVAVDRTATDLSQLEEKSVYQVQQTVVASSQSATTSERESMQQERLNRSSLLRAHVFYTFWHLLVTTPILSAITYFWIKHDQVTTVNGECRSDSDQCHYNVNLAYRLGPALSILLACLLVVAIVCTSCAISIAGISEYEQKHPYHSRNWKRIQLYNIIGLLLFSFIGLAVCWTKYDDVLLYDHPCGDGENLCKKRLKILYDFGVTSICLFLLSLMILPVSIKLVVSESAKKKVWKVYLISITTAVGILTVVGFIVLQVLEDEPGFFSRPYRDPYRKVVSGLWITCLTFMPVFLMFPLYLIIRLMCILIPWIINSIDHTVRNGPVWLWRHCVNTSEQST